MTTGAAEVFAGAVTAGETVLLGVEGVSCACCWPDVEELLSLLTFVLAISGVGALPAKAYPEAIPNTAVADNPVTRILAEVAGFLIFFLFVDAVFTDDLEVGGGGGGRSGSFIISRRPHLRVHRAHHVLRALHGHRHRRHGADVVEPNPLMDCPH